MIRGSIIQEDIAIQDKSTETESRSNFDLSNKNRCNKNNDNEELAIWKTGAQISKPTPQVPHSERTQECLFTTEHHVNVQIIRMRYVYSFCFFFLI